MESDVLILLFLESTIIVAIGLVAIKSQRMKIRVAIIVAMRSAEVIGDFAMMPTPLFFLGR